MESTPNVTILHLNLDFKQIEDLLRQAPYFSHVPPISPCYSWTAEKFGCSVTIPFPDFAVVLHSPWYQVRSKSHLWYQRFRKVFAKVRLDQAQLHFSLPSGPGDEIHPNPDFLQEPVTPCSSDHDDF